MEKPASSETLVLFYQITLLDIPEDDNLNGLENIFRDEDGVSKFLPNLSIYKDTSTPTHFPKIAILRV